MARLITALSKDSHSFLRYITGLTELNRIILYHMKKLTIYRILYHIMRKAVIYNPNVIASFSDMNKPVWWIICMCSFYFFSTSISISVHISAVSVTISVHTRKHIIWHWRWKSLCDRNMTNQGREGCVVTETQLGSERAG